MHTSYVLYSCIYDKEVYIIFLLLFHFVLKVWPICFAFFATKPFDSIALL